MTAKKQEGDLVVRGSRFGIVITRWNSFVVVSRVDNGNIVSLNARTRFHNL